MTLASARERYERIEDFEYLSTDEDKLLLALHSDQIDDNPHRDPEVLREVWGRSDTVTAVADELGCSLSAASKWLHSYGIRQKTDGNRPQFVVDAIETGQESA